MNRNKALQKLKELQESQDTEGAHYGADEVLCDLLHFLGYDDVIEEYHKIGKWYA